jgi:hypothetical protein
MCMGRESKVGGQMEYRWSGDGGVVLRRDCEYFYNMRDVARSMQPHLDHSCYTRRGGVANDDDVFTRKSAPGITLTLTLKVSKDF